MFLLETVIMEYDLLKEVVYFGETFNIPREVKYIATDCDGEIYGYILDPSLSWNKWILNDRDSNKAYILGNCTFQGNWEDSLMVVE